MSPLQLAERNIGEPSLSVDAFQTINQHYEYTKMELVTDIVDGLSEDEENDAELVEEQYNAGVESGHIVGPD